MIHFNNKLSPILIYQMGKVGSSTIRASLFHLNIQNPIFYVHYLSWSSIHSVKQYFLNKSLDIPFHIKLGKALRQAIDQYLGQIRFKIITLVRDPVARNISSTFQNIHLGLPHIEQVEKEKAVNDINNYLLNNFQRFDEKTDQICSWFDKEIKDVFQFDVFSAPFDTINGYKIFSSSYSDILIMRLEDLAACCQKAMYDFLGIENFVLIDKNKGEKKWYADLYNQSLNTIKIPEFYLDQIYNSRFAKHFYTSEELQTFKMKWLNQSHESNASMNNILNQAKYELEQGNIYQSLKLLLPITQRQPNNSFALHLLGSIHWKVGDYNPAVKYYQMACQNEQKC